jgi:hypothetical protein
MVCISTPKGGYMKQIKVQSLKEELDTRLQNVKIPIAEYRNDELSVPLYLPKANSIWSKSKNDSVRENKKLPDELELQSVKNEIRTLSGREKYLTGNLKVDFRRQLLKIHNLYRIIRSGLRESSENIRDEFFDKNETSLLANWNKLKKTISEVERYCV